LMAFLDLGMQVAIRATIAFCWVFCDTLVAWMAIPERAASRFIR